MPGSGFTWAGATEGRPRYAHPRSAWLGHTPFALALMRAARPRSFVELGSHMGVSYCAFCQGAVEAGLETQGRAVDTWAGDPQATFYDESVYRDLRARHDPLYGGFSRLLRMTFDEALAHVPDGATDLLHIDGFHSYEAVRHDFTTWAPKLSERAVVLFHDVNEWSPGFGAWRFWEETSRDRPAFLFPHAHGLGVLAVGAEQTPEMQALFAARGAERRAIRSAFARAGAETIAAAGVRRSAGQRFWIAAKSALRRPLRRVEARFGLALERAAGLSPPAGGAASSS